ncbi:MAG: FAD-binding protein [Pseudomonas sp.]
MNRARDVVVIGGGMAGVAAALASAARGARVTLVRRAPGATALCEGGWNGPLPEPLAAQFAAAGHPWAILQNPLPAPDGSLRRFDRAASAQAAAALTGPTLACGIAGLPSFRAAVLARMWSELSGFAVSSDTIQLEQTPAAGWSPPSLAECIARDPGQAGRMLRERAARVGAQAIILPAVLGLSPDDATRSALESAAGVRVGEALAVAPSIPGWRLGIVLDTLLQRAGVELIHGAALRPDETSRRIDHVMVHNSALQTRLTAAAFVLATGKFLGGGISAEGRLREAALDCPVWIDHVGETFEQVLPLTLTNADRREEQPLLAAGVLVDAEDQPVDRQGERCYDNVWAAGAVRRGYDSSQYGLGHAAAEGWAAGERATA